MLALCINLDHATDRWQHMRDVFRATGMPDDRVHRISAVNDRALTDLEPWTTVATRWAMRHPDKVCVLMRMEEHNGLGCTLSHRRALMHFLAQPGASHAAVFEDDTCLDPRLFPLMRDGPKTDDPRWMPLFRDPPVVDWDYILLGHIHIPFRPRRTMTARLDRVVTLCRADNFFLGSHAYMVTRRGAERLLQHILPVEIHMDWFLGMVTAVGLVNGHMVMPSLSSQCKMFFDNSIMHDASRNYRRAMPYVPLLFVLVALLALVAVVCKRRKDARSSDPGRA